MLLNETMCPCVRPQVLLGPAATCSVVLKDKHHEWRVDLKLPSASTTTPTLGGTELIRYHLLSVLIAGQVGQVQVALQATVCSVS